MGRIVRGLMAAVLICMVFFCCTGMVSIGETRAQTIRVGCVDIERFFSVQADGSVIGYGVEYLEALARFTGWQYEYISGSWTQCMQWLADGDIDLLLPAEYSEGRAERFLFSREPCCKDYAALFCRREDESLYYGDPASYEGLKVGFIRGNYLNQCFEEYAANNALTVYRIEYGSAAELLTALQNGAVDAIVYGNLSPRDDLKLLARFSYMPAYFMTSRKQPELMNALNVAFDELLVENPFFMESLQEKYYGKDERKAIGLTRDEAAYVAEAPPLRVLFDSDNYPLEWYDAQTGQYRGLFVELMNRLAEKCGLRYQAVEPDMTSGWKRLQSGEADLLVSAYSSAYLRSAYHIIYTASYYTATEALVARRGMAFSPEDEITVATLGYQEGTIDYVRQRYPQWKLVECQSADACVSLLKRGSVQAALMNTLVLQANNYLSRNAELVVALPNAVEIPVSLALPEDASPLLLSVLNKAVLKLESEEAQIIATETILSCESAMTLQDWIRRYPFMAVGVGAFLVLAMGVVIFLMVIVRMKNHQNQKLLEKNLELQSIHRMADQLRIDSETDRMTGLLNKSAAENACRACLQENPASPAALFVMDIDNFKQFNDQHGHHFGDQLLENFGAELRTFCRANDIVGRVSGDEFIVFFRQVDDPHLLEHRAQAICRACRNSRTPFSCSMGIALCPENGSTYEAMFAQADAAMYRAKRAGKSGYAFAEAVPLEQPEANDIDAPIS